MNAQGEDVVAGIRTPEDISTLKDIMPEVHDKFIEITNILENHYKDMQDIEFTIEKEKLYILQTRNGKRTAKAAINIAVDLVADDIIDKKEAMPGRRVVILGSGDIGLIMARRMTLEGAKVLVVAELLPYSGGLKRNIVQCLNDFDIPLKLSHTVVNIEGKERVSGITIAEVGPDRKPIPGTEIHYDCDTLLLSCGLIPENELSRGMGVDISPVTNGPVVDESLQTSIPGVFAAGNVLHVHDLVDYVSEEAAAAGRAAVRYLAQGDTAERHEIPVTFEGGIRYTVPASIDPKLAADDLVLRFRVGGVMKKRVVKLLLDDDAVRTRRRPVMAPGEMEELKLTKDMLDAHPGLTRIHITVEEA